MKKIILLAMTALAITACKEKPTDEPIKLDLMGTWRTVQTNGAMTTTNNRTIISYISSSKKTMSLSQFIPEFDEYTWRNKAMGSYSFDGVTLKQDAADAKSTTVATATAIDAQSMRVSYSTFIDKNGDQSPMNLTEIYERVDENLGYDQSIIGLWEGTSNMGEETFGDYHHRWEYKDIDRAGFYTYVYYTYDEDTRSWIAQKQNISDYNVHGSWLATRWQPEGSFKTEYEWWDIDFITDTTMQWSALRMRSDSTGTFRATFNFRRVE